MGVIAAATHVGLKQVAHGDQIEKFSKALGAFHQQIPSQQGEGTPQPGTQRDTEALLGTV
jgi:hypothetical protein